MNTRPAQPTKPLMSRRIFLGPLYLAMLACPPEESAWRFRLVQFSRDVSAHICCTRDNFITCGVVESPRFTLRNEMRGLANTEPTRTLVVGRIPRLRGCRRHREKMTMIHPEVSDGIDL